MADDFDPYYTWLGIRPEEQPVDHYRLIGLRQFEDNADVIANASDRQMQFLRSMQVGKCSAQSQTLLNEISAAGGCLLDPQRKANYDQELRAKEAAKAQAAKAAAAKARPLPKATSLAPIPKPAQTPERTPLPPNDIVSIQVQSSPATPSRAASSSGSKKAAAGLKLKSPAVIAAAGGGALLLVVVIAVAGWMLSGGGGKNSAANKPLAKSPAISAPAKDSAAVPSIAAVPTPKPGRTNKAGAEKPPPDLAKEFRPAESSVPPAETAVAKTNEPAGSNWQPPGPNSAAAFRTLMGTYMYGLDRAKTHPFVNLQVPNKNLWTKEIQDKVRGKISFDEISYVGTAKIAVPADGIYVLDTDRSARVLIDGQVVADWDTPKGEIRIVGGIHDFTFEIGSHGGNWMQESHLAIRQKETGEEVAFFNTWQDIQKFLATPIAGQRVIEVSGWQPSPENELKIDDGLAANLAKTTAPMTADPVTASPGTTPAAKAAVPDAAALDKARKQLVDAFGDEGRGATTPEKKAELAKKMLQVAKESEADPPLQYALLDNARKLFLAAGEADMALTTVDSLGTEFAIDPWPLKTETAAALSEVNVLPALRDRIAARLLAAIDEAVGAQQFGAAEDFSRLATKVSAKGKDIELRKTITQKRADLSRLKQHFAKVEEARAKLATKADDPEANLVVGKFMALALGDFGSGVPFLAKSGKELYVAAATTEQRAMKAEKGTALVAADAWNKLAESLKGEDKGASTAALRRARDWYDIAAVEIQGLEKVRVQKRLKELQGLATTNLRKSYISWHTTPDGFPLIDGVWDESAMPLIIVQREGTFAAACEYQHPTDGRIRWEAEGTISKDGQMTLALDHVQAPKSWTRRQTRTGQLSPDGRTIHGHASSTAGEHDFTWKIRGQSPGAETRLEKSVGRSKAVAGLVGRGFSEDRDVNLFVTYHPGHKLTRDEIQELQNNLGKDNIRVELLGVMTLSADAEVAFHHLGGSSNRGVHFLLLDEKEIHSVGDDRTKDETLTLKLAKGEHTVRWVLTGGDLGDAQLEINVVKSDKNPGAKMEITAPAEMVASARALGVKQEFEYGAKK